MDKETELLILNAKLDLLDDLFLNHKITREEWNNETFKYSSLRIQTSLTGSNITLKKIKYNEDLEDYEVIQNE